ncbi:hypothetical protein Taro_031730 [Colocasia esculenta]|uniref:Uncharacterized protein n=1 Tax=Colocasia esculenta TaxID=4460 RepID=A0A843W400_COLES|nr:hypothetical protein [Colocasia esculenta]
MDAHTYTQLGMSSVLETLCGQAFGAKKYSMLGVYLRTAIVDPPSPLRHTAAAFVHVCRPNPALDGAGRRYRRPGGAGGRLVHPAPLWLLV